MLNEQVSTLLERFSQAIFCDHSGAYIDEGVHWMRFFRMFHVAPQYVYVPGDVERCAFVSAFLRDAFVAAGHHDCVTCPVVHNGIWCPPEAEGDIAREGIMYLGRLNRYKGIDLAAGACQEVGELLSVFGGLGRHEASDVVFNDLDVLEELELSYPGVIHYEGPLRDPDEKWRRLRRAKCVVISSREPESCSLVALEAAAVGCPVVAFRHGGIVEYVPEAIHFVEYVGDDGALVDALAGGLREALSEKQQADTSSFSGRWSVEAMTRRYLSWFAPSS
tara:strand:+ start:1139 stop:1969 length:831 start_codon:yes stop_codon:yes gene_type:complete